MDYEVDFSKYGKKFLCADKVSISEDDAKILVKELFGQMKRADIENTLDRNNLPYDEKTVDRIAESLFEEITERDEMYWDLEDKNILYLYDEKDD